MGFEPRGLATGIGSTPFQETAETLALIKECPPEIPYWPQLPLRGRQQHFVNQFLKPLVKTGLLTDDGERIFFDTTLLNWSDRLTGFYSLYLACEEGESAVLDEFSFPEGAAEGFYALLAEPAGGTGSAALLKGQVVGPLTVAFQLKDERGRFAYYNEQLRDQIVKTPACGTGLLDRDLPDRVYRLAAAVSKKLREEGAAAT